jgi:hypothetical protein
VRFELQTTDRLIPGPQPPTQLTRELCSEEAEVKNRLARVILVRGEVEVFQHAVGQGIADLNGKNSENIRKEAQSSGPTHAYVASI